MFLHLHRPTPPLDRFVELVTYYSGHEPEHTKERLLPDGGVEIIVNLTEDPKRLYDRADYSRSVSFRRAWISGMRRDWIVIEAAPHDSMAVIRFRPGGALPFLGFALEGITGEVEELDSVFGPAVFSLRDRILEAATVEAKMAAIESWLLERARGRLVGHPVVEYLTGRLFAPAGLRITDLAAEVGYSQRHVLGLFRRWVGLTPKQYSRIQRFQQVLAAVSRPESGEPSGDSAPPPAEVGLPEPDWADLAAAHGYFDQSHLVRDFRQFSGLTPGGYCAAYRGLENYLPID